MVCCVSLLTIHTPFDCVGTVHTPVSNRTLRRDRFTFDFTAAAWLLPPIFSDIIARCGYAVRVMDPSTRKQRILRQHIQTDQLLGVDAVPVSRGVDKAALLDEFDKNEVRTCTRCPLHEDRTQTVFGTGDPDADLMFIGEGPGQQEDLQGEPFVGRAGELLTKMIVAMGLSRQQVYIANVVKCRPPNNRTPQPDEVATCTDYLHRQIDIIRPKVIVTLGNPATKHLLATTRGITTTRGQWHEWAGLGPDGPTIAVMPTFHPAYLLRQYTRDNRAKVWSDLLAALDKLGLPRPTSP
jgi:DNA polymerase